MRICSKYWSVFFRILNKFKFNSVDLNMLYTLIHKLYKGNDASRYSYWSECCRNFQWLIFSHFSLIKYSWYIISMIPCEDDFVVVPSDSCLLCHQNNSTLYMINYKTPLSDHVTIIRLVSANRRVAQKVIREFPCPVWLLVSMNHYWLISIWLTFSVHCFL